MNHHDVLVFRRGYLLYHRGVLVCHHDDLLCLRGDDDNRLCSSDLTYQSEYVRLGGSGGGGYSSNRVCHASAKREHHDR